MKKNQTLFPCLLYCKMNFINTALLCAVTALGLRGVLRGTEALGNFGGRRSANPSEPPCDQDHLPFLLIPLIETVNGLQDLTMAFAGQTPTIVVLKEGLCSPLPPGSCQLSGIPQAMLTIVALDV